MTAVQTTLPPHDLSTEEALLGALMGSKTAMDAVSELIAPEDFYRDAHGEVYATLQRLYLKGRRDLDWLSVATELDTETLDKLKGKETLSAWVDFCPAFSNAKYYAEVVRGLRLRRDIIRTGREIELLGFDEGNTPDEALDDAERLMFDVRRDIDHREAVGMQEALEEEMQRYIDISTGARGRGVNPGYQGIEEIIGPLQPGQLIILGARPSVGKTALALNMADRISHDQLVAFYSYEMSRNELIQRLVAMNARLNLTAVKSSALSGDDVSKYGLCIDKLKERHLLIDDDSSLTVHGLKGRLRRLCALKDVKVVMIDYLQLMTLGGKTESRQLEVAAMSRALKLMARELEVPIVALSQLRRPPKEYRNKKPNLDDLRDSGAIEQDADIVMLLHRKEYGEDEEQPAVPELEVIVSKNRQGPLGSVWMPFRGEFQKFEEARL